METMNDDFRIRADDGSVVFVTITDGTGPVSDGLSQQAADAVKAAFEDDSDVIVERRG
jgi:hypothetical protein